MKIRYTEELLKDVIEHQVFPHAPEEFTDFTLNHLVIGTLKKVNGEEQSSVSCILDVNENGILAVLMDPFRADKVGGYQYFKFSNMQGIYIKEKALFCYITIQFTDGTNYVFQVMKRGDKYLPNQNSNIRYINSFLSEQNLNDMDNSIYKKRVVQKKNSALVYIITLIIIEIIALTLFFNNAPDSTLLFLVFVISAAIIHFVLYFLAVLYVDKRKEKEIV